ncbi:RsmB/NOP family class I SAM-dependent RNA methyltransferase [Candidatus Woesearchaeota archaeon]|nr:RsmB/NOP family class I SAM-dependent RNA methyltransferase [Candidatus Woesearchaeota archaeon]
MPKKIPDAEKIQIKKPFEDRYKKILGIRYDEFLNYSLSFLKRSVRVNTLKASVKKVKRSLEQKGWILEKIPWCKEGFWVEHKTGRRDIGCTREHALGYFYVQEAASMIPPVVLQPKAGELVLDLCASPGSKTTQIAQYMENQGLLISNDFKGDRIKSLGINVQRTGLTNTVVTLMFGHWFAKSSLRFDKILVDAPCSGTGTIRKSLKTLRIWNPTMITRLSITQKKLIEAAFKILKRDGILVYSTCSVEPEEDEGVISYLLNNCPDAKIENIKLNLKSSEPVTEFNNEHYHKDVSKCLRLWPQDNDTEGFFVAKIRKV